MRTRTLSPQGPRVSALGLGCTGMSALYGDADRAESIATIHAALEAGITLLDTGDFYGMGHNELLINEALRTVEGGFTGYDGRPDAVKDFAAYSLQRLGTDHIDIYRIARFDPDVPIEETVGAIAELVEAGHVRHTGLSEVGAERLRRAAAVAPISDLRISVAQPPSSTSAGTTCHSAIGRPAPLVRWSAGPLLQEPATFCCRALR